MAWQGWENAEIYDRFVREHRVYRSLNQRIVELARPTGARTVLDLACGSGATTLALLRVLDVDAEIVGVDASEEMIGVARANVLDPRARFVVGTARSIDRVVGETFDRVVCNAAFWQFPDAGPVFAAAARRAAPGALFVLNVPAERVHGERTPIHPFQVALARSIERRTGRPFPSDPTRVDVSGLASSAAAHGWSLVHTSRFLYEGRQAELAELMTIPAMIGPLTEGMTDEGRALVVSEARARTDPGAVVEVPWIYLAFEKEAA
jgi:ubiquinone/menaquinone biosynthesis C-methylase UbiE